MSSEESKYVDLDEHLIEPFGSSLDNYKIEMRFKKDRKKLIEQEPISIELGDEGEVEKVSFSHRIKPIKKKIKIRIRKSTPEKKTEEISYSKTPIRTVIRPMKNEKIEQPEKHISKKEAKDQIKNKEERKETKPEKKEPDKSESKEMEKKSEKKGEEEKIPEKSQSPESQNGHLFEHVGDDHIEELAEKLAQKFLLKKMGEKKAEERKQFPGKEPSVRLKVVEGISLPDIKPSTKLKIEDLEKREIKNFSVRYSLIPKNPKKGERVFAYAEIRWDATQNEIVYNVIEPELTESEKELVRQIKHFIEEKVDISFGELKKKEALSYISKIFDDALDYFKTEFPEDKKQTLKYYIFRDFIGLGPIEPLMNDPRIEDISCDGTNIPLYVYHRDPRLGAIRTNIIFKNKEELDSFVMKLSERCGKTISIAKPLLDGALPDGSRIQATLSSDVATRGSNFTIRKFTESPLTPTHMIEFGTLDLLSAAYLWFCIEHESSILVSGTTATGKTTMLNVLSFFIKPQAKIVSIEDTPELRLAHAHWIPEVARSPISTKKTDVDMFYLLKESLRQRPDYIIVGEVRGKEAYVLFQQISTGHPGLSTIHAESFVKLLDRLTTKPIELPMSSIENIDTIIFLQRIKKGKKYIRRVSEVVEVVGYDRDRKEPVVNRVFMWDPKTDSIKTVGKSFVLKKIAEKTNMSEHEIQEELRRRAEVLEWAVKHGISNYKEFTELINLYQTYPDKLLEKIRE
ncbi:MAG: type II/IV secretion system ATPase subunit [Candidatus Aenigmarchaeota archaeon]|nr:type II/IV secretion system ATPase subunit [Candidatus Aenigmarchaeota archaeon]